MERNAADDLTIIAEARAAVAERYITPWWYHPVLGVMIAVYVTAFALGGTVVKLVAAAVFVLAATRLASTYRRITGVWINGLEAGRASRWSKLVGLVMAVDLAGSWGLHFTTGLVWPVLVLQPFAVVAVVLMGRRFDEAVREQLRSGV
ncbi:hypothetical protein [Kineosporia succinea]|uniref:Ion transporter superfamily protein YfcC n=1 Tax=Kineosporia succinea TaxID=84632 RepID=A0ABT9P8G3_9ACTN|nr:hypothetical protein [Kineosporia succinea]MDP9828752.1 putative ion transporter superfamily protein YfcC [Kineosporia succinea]